jgi:hypothetical protein
MRTLGFRTHLLLALVGAGGLLLTLSRPWYAAAQHTPDEAKDIGDINGPLNGFFGGLKRWVSATDGTSGWQALDHVGVALAAMAGLAAIGALMCLAPPLQSLGRDLLRYGALPPSRSPRGSWSILRATTPSTSCASAPWPPPASP